MNTVWRLFKYVKLYKANALLAVSLAVIVAALTSLMVPLGYPLLKVLFSGEKASVVATGATGDTTGAAGDTTGTGATGAGSAVAAEDKSCADVVIPFANKVRGWSAKAAAATPMAGTAILRAADSADGFLRNRIAPLSKMRLLTYSLFGLVMLTILRGIAVYFQEYTTGKIYTGVSRRIASDLYGRVLGLSMPFYNRVGSPTIISRFTNDVEAVGRGLALLFGKTIVEPLLLAVFVFWALVLNAHLFFINLALFPLLAVGVYVLGKKAKRAMRKGLFGRERLLNILQETFEGISIVKAFNMENREIDRFRAENDHVRRHDLKVVRSDAVVTPLIEIIGVLGISLSLYFGAREVLSGKMDGAEFFLFYGALYATFGPIRKLSNINNRIQVLIAAAARTFEYLDERTEVAEKPDARKLGRFSREVRFDNVSFAYNSDTIVLKEINISARRGEIIALVGPSGGGKSTIARLVPRFYDAASGAVLVDGVDVRDATLASLREQIGLVTQEVILFNDTIAANIAYGRPGASAEEIVAAAKAANAAGFIAQLPHGYKSIIGEKGLTLSGGQRQRIALARAILKDPPILILDEATSALDSESEHLIQKALDEFMKDRTSIVIAHRLSTVKRANRIYVIESGRIIASGTSDELLNACPTYKALYSRQFQGA